MIGGDGTPPLFLLGGTGTAGLGHHVAPISFATFGGTRLALTPIARVLKFAAGGGEAWNWSFAYEARFVCNVVHVTILHVASVVGRTTTVACCAVAEVAIRLAGTLLQRGAAGGVITETCYHLYFSAFFLSQLGMPLGQYVGMRECWLVTNMYL